MMPAPLSRNLLPLPTKFRTHPFPANLTPIHIAKSTSNSLKISCSKEKELFTGEMLSEDLGFAVKKLRSDIVEREEALKKSREVLFAEVSSFVGLKSEDFKNKWRRMNEGERWVLVKGFVAEWSAHFHPLSARSVKEMVDEYVGQWDQFSDSASATANLFSHFRRLLGFSRNNEE